MNWLTSYVKPTLKNLMGPKRDVPENLWTKCNNCSQMLFQKDLPKTAHVCRHCNHHMPLDARKRLEHTFDDGLFELIEVPAAIHDPLHFKDKKKYAERLKLYRQSTNEHEAILVAEGKIQGQRAVVAAFNFAFMGGSMSIYVGEGIVQGANHARNEKIPYIIVPASGGARMQEGILSLMQMPRTIIAIQQLKEAHLPYIVLLTNPTTGGVSASFAMVGDIIIAEPKALIGFTGARVIQETIREKLPEGFQTAEYLLEHGQIDMVVPRSEIPKTLGKLMSMLLNKKSLPGTV